MKTYDSFERIYEVNGIPITLFEIEEWWENSTFDQKRGLQNPDVGDEARKKIAERIYNELVQKTNNKQFQLLKQVKQDHQRQKESLDKFVSNYLFKKDNIRIDYDEPEPYGPNYQRNTYFDQRPKDLDQIPNDLDPTAHFGSNSLFNYAMRQAQEKLRKEQELKYKQQQYYQQRYTPPPVELKPIKKSWRIIFGFSQTEQVNTEKLNKIFREKAKIMHPDVGGSEKDMKELIDARNDALNEIVE